MEDVDIADASKALYEAPFGILAHKLPEPGDDQSEPTFVYANQVSPPSAYPEACPVARVCAHSARQPIESTNYDTKAVEDSACMLRAGGSGPVRDELGRAYRTAQQRQRRS